MPLPSDAHEYTGGVGLRLAECRTHGTPRPLCLRDRKRTLPLISRPLWTKGSRPGGGLPQPARDASFCVQLGSRARFAGRGEPPREPASGRSSVARRSASRRRSDGLPTGITSQLASFHQSSASGALAGAALLEVVLLDSDAAWVDASIPMRATVHAVAEDGRRSTSEPGVGAAHHDYHRAAGRKAMSALFRERRSRAAAGPVSETAHASGRRCLSRLSRLLRISQKQALCGRRSTEPDHRAHGPTRTNSGAGEPPNGEPTVIARRCRRRGCLRGETGRRQLMSAAKGPTSTMPERLHQSSRSRDELDSTVCVAVLGGLHCQRHT